VQKSLSISSGYRESYLAQFAQNHPDWTTYFPVEEHYAAWIKINGNTVPTVACDPLVDETVMDEIPSYKKDGTMLTLFANTIPGEPVLVITPESFTGDTISGEYEGGGRSEPLWRVSVCAFHLYNDHEPWIRGAPEIYINAWRYPTTTKITTWFDSGNRNVDKECVVYPYYMNWNWGDGILIYTWGQYHHPYDCNPIKVMEDDPWPDADDLVQEITPTVPNPYGRVTLGSHLGAELELLFHWE
jgi:hypothetical protein